MTEWCWITEDVIHTVHADQLAEHGGLDGVRDQGALSSALARPMNLAAYGTPDAADLTASYVVGVARAHGFVDGNKRTAWITGRLFLLSNGFAVSHSSVSDVVALMLNVATGVVTEAELAAWFRGRIVPAS